MLDRAKPAPRRTVLRQAALHANLRRPTQPAFAVYRTDPHAPIAHATGLIVLTLEGAQIAAITNFLGSSALPQFGLPRTLPL
jgi:RNA polymerase sigma-70 factor (ECF subfamily)